MGISGDDLVVSTEDLSRIVNAWALRHDADHPRLNEFPRNARHKDAVGQFSAQQYLVFHSGLGEKAIRMVLKPKYKWTTLEKADKLLAVIEDTGAFEDGRLTLVTYSTVVAQQPRRVKKPRRGQRKTRGVKAPRGAKT